MKREINVVTVKCSLELGGGGVRFISVFGVIWMTSHTHTHTQKQNKNNNKLFTHAESHPSAVSLLESGE